MKADKVTIGRVFDRTERLEAPLFQRPYVWTQETNWEPLWESIRSVAEKRLSEHKTPPHFLGAIVLDQVSTSTGKLHARLIIDGQQRLTTLQLAFAAIRDLCGQLGQDRYSKAFEKLTANDVPLSDDADDVFKVWPTNADRSDFRAVMRAASAPAVRKLDHAHPDDEWLIPNAYLYFSDVFLEWLGPVGGDGFAKRLDALYWSLLDDMHVVVIDLDHDDDAQEIFETLNALGTPLLPADLVKNYLFHRAQLEGHDTRKLYDRYWSSFEEERGYWRKEIRQGRLKRPRLDLFIFHYLTLALGEEILAGQLFSSYRALVEKDGGLGTAEHMEQLRSYAEVYRSFDEFPADSREGRFFYRLDQLDTTTVLPLLLEGFRRHRQTSGHADLLQILDDLESFLVRRTICGLTTQHYNRLFVDLVRHLHQSGSFGAEAVRAFLLKQEADTARWPDDGEFGRAWLSLEFYKRIKRSRLRVILEALEESLHSEKTERVHVEHKLTVEHLLPREWERHWPLPSGDDDDKTYERRSQSLHQIGNLTLLTRELNPSISNGPWERKRREILKHSALNLNRTLPEVWNEDAIEERTRALFAVAVRTWRRP